ncbi:SET domain-containing protein, partial [Schizophyllum commune]
FMYDDQKLLKRFDLPVFECNSLCSCTTACQNRVAQLGRSMPLRVMSTVHKGWAVFNGSSNIRRGQFIGFFIGELTKESESDSSSSLHEYAFDIDFWFLRRNNPALPPPPAGEREDTDRLQFTRLINHSCDPNLAVVGVYVNEGDLDKPLLAFFSTRDIKSEEELTISYRQATCEEDDDSNDPEVVKGPHCLCGSEKCDGKPWHAISPWQPPEPSAGRPLYTSVRRNQ